MFLKTIKARGLLWSVLALVLLLFAACAAATPEDANGGAGTHSAAATEVSKTETPKNDQSKGESAQTELVISAAASLIDVTKELSEQYAAQSPNVKLTFVYGASGALQTQIEEGAPSDLFISAGKKQMDALEEKGLLSQNARADLLRNAVVLIAPKDSNLALGGFADCASDRVKLIALGEPKSVPAGQYAEEIFAHYQCLDAVAAKANYGTDVRQVLTWVENGEVDCGVVYASDAAVSQGVKVLRVAPEESHKAVLYPASVLARSERPQEAQEFLSFLQSPDAMKVFEKYGFTAP